MKIELSENKRSNKFLDHVRPLLGAQVIKPPANRVTYFACLNIICDYLYLEIHSCSRVNRWDFPCI
jgi:hypothetical protein